jgi:Tol biopolymer transport system component
MNLSFMRDGLPIPITPPASRRLDSWKEIAEYLRRQVRTVQRWEREQELPVHRHVHRKRSSVYAFASELDAWWTTRAPVLEKDPENGTPESPAEAKPTPRAWSAKALLLAAAVVALTTLAVLGLGSKFSSAGPFQKIDIQPLINAGNVGMATISPDGRYLVYTLMGPEGASLWLRHMATGSSTQIGRPEKAGYGDFRGGHLTFSHDGNHIYFVRARELYEIPVLGGPVRKLLSDVIGPITLSPDGQRFAFRRETRDGESALLVANIDGTDARKVVVHKSPEFIQAPAWAPAGKVIAYVAGRSGAGGMEMTVAAVAPDGGTEKVIAQRKWWAVLDAAWLSDGGGLILLVRDQPLKLQQYWYLSYPSGGARKISNDLANYGAPSLTADSRTLVTVTPQDLENLWIVPSRGMTAAKQITGGLRRQDGNWGVAWAPDGRVLYTSSASSGLTHIWSSKADGSDVRQLTTEGFTNQYPKVCPNGRYVVFSSDRTGWRHVWRMDLDGSRPKQLTSGGDEAFPDCSPDGQWVVYSNVAAGGTTLWKVAIDGGTPIQISAETLDMPSISPDGKWIAGSYQTSSGLQVAVLPWEGGKTANLFITDHPMLQWTPDSKALLYAKSQDGVADVWSQPLADLPPEQLTHFTSHNIRWFALSADGQQLALSRGDVNRDAVLIRDLR